MPVITSIEPQEKNKNWVAIFLDGKYAFSLPLETLVIEKLKEKTELSEERIKQLVKGSQFSQIWDTVLKFLSFRPRSSKEVRSYLERKKIGEETQSDIMGKLLEKKLIDDEEFARWWRCQRESFHLQGKQLTKIELKRKGIDNEIIERVLQEGGVHDRRLAEELVLKKLERMKKLPLLEKKKKLYRILSQRGFSWEVVRAVVDNIVPK